MDCVIALLAHEGASPTIRDFQPQWMKLGLPIVAFLPEGDKWPGDPVYQVVTLGKTAHRGDLAVARFLGVCEWLLNSESNWDMFWIMEYDTLNLTDKLPDVNAMVVNIAAMKVSGHGPLDGQVLAFSPWVMTRPMLAALIESMKMQLRNPTEVEWVDGLIDRWLGRVIVDGNIPWSNIPACLAWCEDRWEPHRRIAEQKKTIVHSWKRKEQFKHLWTT